MDSKKTDQLQSADSEQFTVESGYSRALDYFNAQRYTEADKLCTAIIQAVPNHVDSLNLLGAIAQKISRHDLAVEQFQKAINIDNSRALLYYNLGGSLNLLGRRDEAIKVLKIALEKEPGNSQISDYLHSITINSIPGPEIGNLQNKAQEALQRGIELHQSGRLDKAIQWYLKTLEINPENTAALSNMGAALQTTGKLEEAVSSYQKAISIKPDYADAYSNLANTLQEQGKLKEAVTSCQKAISIQPDNAEAYNNLGTVLKKQRKLAEAVASYQKAISIKKDFVKAYSNLGSTLTDQGKLDEAVTIFNQAISIKPDYAEAYYNLSQPLKEQGKVEEAVTSYKKAISIKPDFADAYSNLGVLLQEQGKLEEAVASYQKAISIKPDHNNFIMNLNSVKEEIIENFIVNIGNNEQRINLDANQLIPEDLRHKELKVNLLFCPFVDPTTPPLGIASLKAYLKEYGDMQIHCVDLNLEWHLMIVGEKTSRLNEDYFQPGLEELQNGEKLFRNSSSEFFDVDKYKGISTSFVSALHNAHLDNQYSLCLDHQHKEKNVISDMTHLAVDNNPDIVGFSILFDSQVLYSLLLAKEIKKKKPQTIVVFGGAGILSSFEKIINNPYVDFVISDAGEAAFNELLKSIQSGKFNDAIPGVAYKMDGIYIKNKPTQSNLNHNAYPDFSDLDLGKYFTPEVVVPILSSKGCFWRRCSFCEEGSINMYSVASVNRVVDEIEHHYSSGHCYFQFIDEMISPKRLRMLSNEILIRKLNVFFYATLRPSADFNEETLQLMHRAGFRYVIWGVESCNQRVLKLINKGTTIETIHNTLKISKNAGIRNHIFMMVGFPTETPDELFETMQFIHKNREYIHKIHSGVFSLCQGTEIFQNPEKFDLTIKSKGVDSSQYLTEHKKGTTGNKGKLYHSHYLKFLDQFAIIPIFGILRDHALLYYKEFSINELEKMRDDIPPPVPMGCK